MTAQRCFIGLLLASVSAVALAAAPAASGPANLAAGGVFRDCAECPPMVVVPPGEFAMGYDGGEQDRYEGPVRQVTIDASFAAGRFPITNADYARFVSSANYQGGQGCNFWDSDRSELIWVEELSWRDPGHGRPIVDNEPVVCVSWLDSQAYVRWLSEQTRQPYRLLTEAEWEYIARAGAATQYPWSDDPDAACQYANVADLSAVNAAMAWPHAKCNDGFAGLAPVDAFPANGFGLHDVIGNSWEWVNDCYIAPYPDQPANGSAVQVEGQCELHAVRGGAWISTPFRQRSSWRGRDPEDKLTFIFGFRIARDLP